MIALDEVGVPIVCIVFRPEASFEFNRFLQPLLTHHHRFHFKWLMPSAVFRWVQHDHIDSL